jgi:hypothetical protein
VLTAAVASQYLYDKSRRYIGKSQSKRPPKRTQRPPHLPQLAQQHPARPLAQQALRLERTDLVPVALLSLLLAIQHRRRTGNTTVKTEMQRTGPTLAVAAEPAAALAAAPPAPRRFFCCECFTSKRAGALAATVVSQCFLTRTDVT